MTAMHKEIEANWQRAGDSLRAARALLDQGFADTAASRAYYAAFYACTALLLAHGREFSKHSGVIATIHKDFVRTGKIGAHIGEALNHLFELRATGDYGVTVHVSNEEAEKAIGAAETIIIILRGVEKEGKR